MTFAEYTTTIEKQFIVRPLPLRCSNELQEAYDSEVPVEFVVHVFNMRVKENNTNQPTP